MITFARESWDKFKPDLDILSPDHYSDVGIFGSVDHERMLEIERNGTLRVYTQRFNGKLFGYWFGYLFNNVLLGGQICAMNQALYISRDFRGLGYGKMMIQYAEESLRKEGAIMIYQSFRKKNDLFNMLSHIGYEEGEMIMEKRL